MLSFWEKSFFSDIDAAVIGSGILGLSAACSIKEKNPKASVLVIERGIVPTGASTKNAGFFTFGSHTEILADISTVGEDAAVRLVEKRVQGIRLLRQRLGEADIGYNNFGGYELLNEKYLPSLEKLDFVNNLLKDVFRDDAFIVRNELIGEFGFDKTFVRALLYSPFESQIDTGKMMNALLKYARSLGISILNGCEVVSLNDNGNNVELITRDLLRNGTIIMNPKRVAVAVNAFVKSLLPDMEIAPGRGHVLITKPISGLKLRGVFHFDEGYYYFRNLEDRVLLGGARNVDFESEATTSFEINPVIMNTLEKFLVNVILPGRKFEIEQQWTGIMAFTKDKLPMIKKYSDRLIAAISCNGMGIALSSKIGEEISLTLSP
jgi:gamma-glutamylputrescine oxidase